MDKTQELLQAAKRRLLEKAAQMSQLNYDSLMMEIDRVLGAVYTELTKPVEAPVAPVTTETDGA